MKLFLIGLGHMRPEQIEVARALHKKHEIQYWVRMGGIFPINEREFPGTIFHEYLDALDAKPALGIDGNEFDPWSSDEIVAYAAVESEFMTMVDKWHPTWSVNQRKELYYEMLRYWGGVLGRFKPDCIIIPVVPHEMYSFVLYTLARTRGIKTIILDAVLDEAHYAIIEDYKRGNEILAHACDSPSGHITVDNLSHELKEHYERVSRKTAPEAPLAMRQFIKQQTIWNSFKMWRAAVKKFIRDGSIIERSLLKLIKLSKPDLRDEYRHQVRPADIEKSFVYMPLHYQPEATTSPQGGIFVDQLLMVRMVAAALPVGWELYVKEHPAQLIVHGGNVTPARYKGFYTMISSIPRVRLVSTATDSFLLADHAKTTVTVTGTAGWESILRGKPVLIFGYPWYLKAPGIIQVASTEECRKAFEYIENGFAPQQKEILQYLSAVDAVAHVGYLQTPTPGFEDQWNVMYEEIEAALV